MVSLTTGADAVRNGGPVNSLTGQTLDGAGIGIAVLDSGVDAAHVAFRNEKADVLLRPTGSVEVARARLTEVPTGGRTPLAAGITAGLDLALRSHGEHRPLLVLVTDGRHTEGPDPMEAAALVKRRGVPAVVVDAEDSRPRLGLARPLADAMGARYLTLPELSPEALR